MKFPKLDSPDPQASPGSSPAEKDWQAALLNLADMLSPFSHELHNVFNSMVLQAAILVREAPQPLHTKVNVFRTLALRASDLVARLDRYRYQVSTASKAVDLGETVRNVVQQFQARGQAIEAELPAELPPVQGNEPDLRRLLELLVSSALAAGPPVVVRAEPRDGKVVLTVLDSGPHLEAEKLEGFFEPFRQSVQSDHALERAACQGIARRLQATLHAENGVSRGVAVSVRLDAA